MSSSPLHCPWHSQNLHSSRSRPLCSGLRCLACSPPTVLLPAHTDPATYTSSFTLRLARCIFVQGLCTWWFHCQECLGLDIHKTCFFNFLRYCPFNEAFPLRPVYNRNFPRHTYRHTLRLSCFPFSLFSITLTAVLTCYIFYRCTCLLPFSPG